jgi:glycosyltransferase involved in cell wall biosynthesis
MTFPHTRRVAAFLDDFEPDVIHVATEGPVGLMGRHHALRRDVPLVTSFHTQFPQYARHYGFPFLEPLVWRWLEWFHRPARWTHTPGELVRDELIAHGVTQARVWGYGVNTREFHPDKRDRHWRRGFGIDDNDVLILHVGRLAPEKNLRTLTSAWQIAREAIGRHAVFVVAGDGPLAREIDSEMPWARRLGFLDRHALATLYASADICVLPSPTETCGLVALEAMSSGMAVVAANAGGFRESIQHERSGVLVPPIDTLGFAARIVELTMNAALRRRIGAQAREAALQRDVVPENAALIEQYAELLGPPQVEGASCAA